MLEYREDVPRGALPRLPATMEGTVPCALYSSDMPYEGPMPPADVARGEVTTTQTRAGVRRLRRPRPPQTSLRWTSPSRRRRLPLRCPCRNPCPRPCRPPRPRHLRSRPPRRRHRREPTGRSVHPHRLGRLHQRLLVGWLRRRRVRLVPLQHGSRSRTFQDRCWRLERRLIKPGSAVLRDSADQSHR